MAVLLPAIVCAQQPYYKSTLLDYEWQCVGNADFSGDTIQYTSLAFSPSDSGPYVAYNDGADSFKVTVMKYDSVMVGINKSKESKFSLYPNPATDKTTVELSLTPANSQLSMMNLNGQQLITHKIAEPRTQVDISSLPSGVYFVRLTREKTVQVGKFVKQ